MTIESRIKQRIERRDVDPSPREQAFYNAFGVPSLDRIDELFRRRGATDQILDYLAVEECGMEVSDWAALADIDTDEVRENVNDAEGTKNKQTNWELDEEIVEVLDADPAFNKSGLDAHHGHVSRYIEGGMARCWSFRKIPRQKVKKLASAVVERRPSTATDGTVTTKEQLYQVAGSFHLIERKIEYSVEDADVQYLKWGKGKEKYEELQGESYNEFISNERDENGRQPWMHSTPGWTESDERDHTENEIVEKRKEELLEECEEYLQEGS